MDTAKLLDLFCYQGESNENKSADGVDQLGNLQTNSQRGVKAMLDSIQELWDENQYQEEYDLKSFLRTLKK